MQRARRRARKLAFQALFMMDARDQWSSAAVHEFLVRTEPAVPEDVRTYVGRLVENFLVHQAQVDHFVGHAHPDWQLVRMRSEDRALLRLGVTELWYHDVPHRVVINEWIELTKLFSGEDGPDFINAVLDRAHHDGPESDATG